MTDGDQVSWEERYAWLDERLKKLLKAEPWLLQKLQEPGGVSWVVLEYWHVFEGLQYRWSNFTRNPTSPETIIRRLRYLGLTRERLREERMKTSSTQLPEPSSNAE